MASAAEAALVECERERRTLLDFLLVIPVGLGRLNARGDVDLANPELARLMQTLNPGAGLSNFFDYVAPLAPELLAKARGFCAPTGKVFEDARVLVADASCGVEALSCTLIKLQGDDFIAIVRDVTDAAQRERELARARELLELSQRIAHVGHYRIDLAARTVVLSDELFRICGREPQAGPRSVDEVRSWLHANALASGAVPGAAGPKSRRGRWEESRIVRPDGDERGILGWWEPERDAAGALAAINGVLIDVTERKRFEREQIRLRDAAEQASRAKSDFLAVMSHELRTPMNGVLGINALLIETELTPEQQMMAEIVQQSANALLGVLDDILTVAQLGAGRIELKTAEFELRPLVGSLVELMGATADAKGLALKQEFAGLDGGTFRGDAARLRQILIVFVSNAIKFTERGGVKIAIKGTPESEGRTKLRFEVRDSGVGVSDEAKARLFQPFVQQDSSISRHYGGSGLGLSISRGLVELMGGVCGVADRPGGGSIFWFEIALRPAKPAAKPAPAPVKGSGSVLVVEDTKVNAEIARLVLGGAGFQVRIAVDGIEAVEAARGQAFDLILMDLHMPRMDGLAATRVIRSLTGIAAQTPIVGISANALPETERACRDAGMDDWIVKPFAPAKLREAAIKWAGAAKA